LQFGAPPARALPALDQLVRNVGELVGLPPLFGALPARLVERFPPRDLELAALRLGERAGGVEDRFLVIVTRIAKISGLKLITS